MQLNRKKTRVNGVSTATIKNTIENTLIKNNLTTF